MGNYRFKLSDMMPNAWFYKLRDMGKSSGNISRRQKLLHNSIKQFSLPCDQQTQSQTREFYMPNRPSNYYSKASDAHFPLDPPRKSSKGKARRKSTKNIVSSPVSASCSCQRWKADNFADYTDTNGVQNLELNSCSCKTSSSSTDVIVDMASRKTKGSYIEFNDASEPKLKPILTKPSEQLHKLSNEQSKSRLKAARTPPGLQRLRRRTNSPRIITKKVQADRGWKNSASAPRSAAATVHRQRGLPETLAVVKSSSDPQKDFRDSMTEMIVENNIRSSKDLEELLACYLSLNSNDCHAVIIQVFKQLCFDLTDVDIVK